MPNDIPSLRQLIEPIGWKIGIPPEDCAAGEAGASSSGNFQGTMSGGRGD